MMSSCPEWSTEDDMAEGDLGDGMGARCRKHHTPLPQKKTFGNLWNVFSQSHHFNGESERSPGPFSWTSCRAMYTVFKKEMDDEQAARREKRQSESLSEDTSEELQRRLWEVTEEVELLRTELEVAHRHLEGKHEALRILQGQAIFDKATCHTKMLLQKSEERNKALEKEVNGLQWEITFNQVQFKNLENTWSLKYERVVTENEALKKALEEKNRANQEQKTENGSLSQKCLELFAMLNGKERMEFQRTQPCCSMRTDGSALEMAVYGACQCNTNGGEPCPCAKSAAASRKQVLQLKQELEQERKKKEEAFVMMDAFRIAFEQQLRRVTENVLQKPVFERSHTDYQGNDKGKPWSFSVGEKLKKILPALNEEKIISDSSQTLQLLLDLLNDKEEALAHQRKVSYMLARITEDLEKRLQIQLEELGLSHQDRGVENSEKREWEEGEHTSINCEKGSASAAEETSGSTQTVTKSGNKDV